MSSPQTTAQNSSIQPPITQNSQRKGTTPPHGVSGKYRIANLPQPMHLHAAVYVLSYEGSAWPAHEQYDGILGVYASLENAQRAGTRWLKEQPGLHSDRFGSPETRISEWEVDGEGGGWRKEKAVNGLGFLESRVMRIKECEVRTEGSLPKEPKDGGGKKDEGGGNDGVEGQEGQKDHVGDEQDDVKGKGEGGTVEGMQRLAV